MLVAAGHNGSAEERHADHDEDLHLVGGEKRDAKQIAPHHVGEVQNHGHDEGDRQHEFDGPRNPVERLVDHRTILPFAPTTAPCGQSSCPQSILSNSRRRCTNLCSDEFLQVPSNRGRVGRRTRLAAGFGARTSVETLAARPRCGAGGQRRGHSGVVARPGRPGPCRARRRSRGGGAPRNPAGVRGTGPRLLPGAAARRGGNEPRACRPTVKCHARAYSKICIRARQWLR